MVHYSIDDLRPAETSAENTPDTRLIRGPIEEKHIANIMATLRAFETLPIFGHLTIRRLFGCGSTVNSSNGMPFYINLCIAYH